MKKFFTFLAAAVVSFGAMATTFTFTSDGSVSQSADGITVRIEKGSGNNAPAHYNNGLRLYASNTITVSGASLSNISLTFSKQGSKDYATLSASTGSLVSGGVSTGDTDLVTDTWTGSGSSVTFTLGSSGQRLINSIIVNEDGSETPPSNPDTPDTPSTPDGLDPDFVYPDPSVIGKPSITVQGDAYKFIQGNIEVSCTKGACSDTYFSAHAGFDLTFTATKPIKGLVINGFVKKDFTATANHGSISYLTPDKDTDADPVLVLTDVNSTSVTISCVKQLRCYSVEVYFAENPDATVSGGSNGGNSGEATVLNFDSAEVIHEIEYSEEVGEPNYTVFLFNASAPDVPYFALDLYPGKEDITGTYTWDDWTLGDYTYYIFGYGDDDMTWVEDGTVTITKSGNVYTIKGTFLCDDSKTYTVSYSGTPDFYTDDEYYGDGSGDESGVGSVLTEMKEGDSTMYDLQGRKVREGFRGIYIRNGKKQVGF